MKTLIAVVAIAASAASAEAQMTFRVGGPGGMAGTGGEFLDRPPSVYGVTGWKVGEWARYSIQTAMGQPGMTMQTFRSVSVVGEDAGKFWVEVAEETVSPMQMRSPTRKLLVPFGPALESAMSEMLVLRQDSSIVRTTVVKPAKVTPPSSPFPASWEKVGEESLQVRAGTFKTIHYKKGTQDLWVSATAGPIGVVRFKNDQSTLELVAHETTGAKSEINVGSNE